MTYIQTVRATVAVKGADTTRTNTATLAADPDLSLPLEANSTYTLSVDLVYASSLLAGMKVGFTMPAGSTLNFMDGTSNNSNIATLIGTIVAGVTGSSDQYLYIRGICRTGSTPGNLSLNWAQNVASALSSATLRANSSIIAFKTKP